MCGLFPMGPGTLSTGHSSGSPIDNVFERMNIASAGKETVRMAG